MMTSIESYVRLGRGRLHHWTADPRVCAVAKALLWIGSGFFLSAASLAHHALPLCFGMLCACTEWEAVLVALGGSAGYLAFWGSAGLQGLLWMGFGLAVALTVGRKAVIEEYPIILPGLAGFLVSLSGLIFQVVWEDKTKVPVYLLRIMVGASAAALFQQVRRNRDTVLDWMVEGVGVLALAQVIPFPFCNLGCIAGGMLSAGGAFPAAALAGMALDLSRISQVPMTAVLTLSYLTRLIPWGSKWAGYAAPGAVYLLVMGLCGSWDLMPLPGLIVGGALAVLLPARPELSHRRGETGQAQVRLEIASGVLSQCRQMLLEIDPLPVDEQALVDRAQERACGGCPCRKVCHERLKTLPSQLLHRPLVENTNLPAGCKKPGRMVLELRRSQEQLRAIKAERLRQEECRAAVGQQYLFLSNYLQQLSDQLPRRGIGMRQRYKPEVSVCTSSREGANGDRCLRFAGTENRYYVLLCDGMGTGMGAAQEGQTVASMLRRMLIAGFPAEYALRSVNAMAVLRGRAGAFTADLAEIYLDSGRAQIYKWGAAPSYRLTGAGAEKIGTATPPPGLSVSDTRETVEKLSLCRGEVLILISDGVDGEGALRRIVGAFQQPTGELAAKILEAGSAKSEDDATAAVIRLNPAVLVT